MIPLRNKELLIKHLTEGYTIVEACKAAQVSKASLYRFFKSNPGFKEDVDQAIFKANDETKEITKDVEKRNMENVRKIIMRRDRP